MHFRKNFFSLKRSLKKAYNFIIQFCCCFPIPVKIEEFEMSVMKTTEDLSQDQNQEEKKDPPPEKSIPPPVPPRLNKPALSKEEIENGGSSSAKSISKSRPVVRFKTPMATEINGGNVSYNSSYDSPYESPAISAMESEKCRDWTLVSVWHPKLPEIERDPDSNGSALVRGTKWKFELAIEDVLSHMNDYLDPFMEPGFIVVVVLPSDLERPPSPPHTFQLSVDQVRFELVHPLFMKPKCSSIVKHHVTSIHASGGLAEVLRAVVTPRDVLVICGGYKLEPKVLKNDEFICELSGNHIMETKIIRFWGRMRSQIMLLEKIQPMETTDNDFKFTYITRKDNSVREVVQHRKFSPETFCRNVTDTLAYSRIRWDFPMPMIRGVDPETIFDLLTNPKFTMFQQSTPPNTKLRKFRNDSYAGANVSKVRTSSPSPSPKSSPERKRSSPTTHTENVSQSRSTSKKSRRSHVSFTDSDSDHDDMRNDKTTYVQRYKSSKNKFFTNSKPSFPRRIWFYRFLEPEAPNENQRREGNSQRKPKSVGMKQKISVIFYILVLILFAALVFMWNTTHLLDYIASGNSQTEEDLTSLESIQEGQQKGFPYFDLLYYFRPGSDTNAKTASVKEPDPLPLPAMEERKNFRMTGKLIIDIKDLQIIAPEFPPKTEQGRFMAVVYDVKNDVCNWFWCVIDWISENLCLECILSKVGIIGDSENYYL